MKKLLHERLRDEEAIYEGRITTDSGQRVADLYEREMEALAEEIEKYYIPRPRFEDGEPVRVGDSFIQKCINEEVELSKIGIALYTSDCLNMVWFPDEVVPRPAPKVLDADGVEIKVGDTVWHKEMGIKFLVTKLPTPDYYSSVEVKTTELPIYTTGYDPNLLTHSEPDSLEKLRDDIAGFKAEGTYHGAIDAFLQRCEDRLTALIERGM